jgi:hypothetical protein
MFVIALGHRCTLVWQSFFRNLAQPFVFTSAPATLDNYDFVPLSIFLSAVKTSVLRRRWQRPSWPVSPRDGLDRATLRRATASCSTRLPSRDRDPGVIVGATSRRLSHAADPVYPRSGSLSPT